MTDQDNKREAARHVKGATIAWGGGDYINLEQPDDVQVEIEDYAYCLAYTQRWRGQCRTAGRDRPFYGVGQHVVFGAEQMLDAGLSPADALAFLMHESDEVPFGDFPGPAKKLPEVAPIITLAKRIGTSIDRHFDFPVPDPALIKRWDIRMLVTEKRDLLVSSFGNDSWHHDGDGDAAEGYEPFEERIVAYEHPREAAERFLFLYRMLRFGEVT